MIERNSSLVDLADRLNGERERRHLNVEQSLADISVENHPSLPGFYIVRNKRKISPSITADQLLATIHHLGGRIKSIRTNLDQSEFGNRSLVLQPEQNEEFRPAEVLRISLENAQIRILNGSNVVLLTSEKDGLFYVRGGIQRETLDNVRSILLKSLGYLPQEAVIRQFELGPSIVTETTAFILE